MSKPLLLVDFNEMLESNLVLLSASDFKTTSDGNALHLSEGLAVDIYCEDTDEHGQADNLVASGVVEANQTKGWGSRVKWCCRIDDNGVRHQSEK